MQHQLVATDSGRPTGARPFAGAEAEADNQTERPTARPITILIVDNDPVLRMLLAKFLTFVGYAALDARSGREALEIAKRHSEPIDLLLTDVMMPRMNGFELAEAFHELHPESKLLYMSGHVFDVPDVADAASANPDAFMVKPFWAEQLLEKVQSILPGPGPSGQDS